MHHLNNCGNMKCNFGFLPMHQSRWSLFECVPLPMWEWLTHRSYSIIFYSFHLSSSFLGLPHYLRRWYLDTTSIMYDYALSQLKLPSHGLSRTCPCWYSSWAFGLGQTLLLRAPSLSKTLACWIHEVMANSVTWYQLRTLMPTPRLMPT